MPLGLPLFFVGLAKKPLSTPLVMTRSAIDIIASRIVETIQLLDAAANSPPGTPSPSPIATLIKNHGRLDTGLTLVVVEVLASALFVKRLGVREACVQMEALLAVRVKTQVKFVDELVGKAGKAGRDMVTWLPRRVDRKMRAMFGECYLANCTAPFEVALSCAEEWLQPFLVTEMGEPTLLALTCRESIDYITHFYHSLTTFLAELPSITYKALSDFLDELALQSGEGTFLGELSECLLQVYALGLSIANIILAFICALTFVEGEDVQPSIEQVRSVRQLARETPIGAAGGIFGGQHQQQQDVDVGEGPSGTRSMEDKESGNVEEPTTPAVTDKKGKGKEQVIETPAKPKAEGSSKSQTQNSPPVIAEAKPYVTSATTSATTGGPSSDAPAEEGQDTKPDASYSLNAPPNAPKDPTPTDPTAPVDSATLVQVETPAQTTEEPKSAKKPVSEIVREIVANLSKKGNASTAATRKGDVPVVGDDKPAVANLKRPALQETTNTKRTTTVATTTTTASATITSRPAHHPARPSHKKQKTDENAPPVAIKSEVKNPKGKAKGKPQDQQVNHDFGVLDQKTSTATSTATTATATAVDESTSTPSAANDSAPLVPLKFRDGMSRRERRLMFQEIVKMRLQSSSGGLNANLPAKTDDKSQCTTSSANDDVKITNAVHEGGTSPGSHGVDGQKVGGSEEDVKMEAQKERPENASIVTYPSTESIRINLGSQASLPERTMHSDEPCTPMPSTSTAQATALHATLARPTFEQPSPSQSSNPDEQSTPTPLSMTANAETPMSTTNPDQQLTSSGSVVSFYSKFSAPRPEREETRYAPPGIFGSVALPAPLREGSSRQDPFLDTLTSVHPSTAASNRETQPVPIRIPWFPQAAPNRAIPPFWDPPAPYAPIKITPPMRKRRNKGSARRATEAAEAVEKEAASGSGN